jgi:hypothetical protein
MGMPLMEFSNWLHQITWFYGTSITAFFIVNNMLVPKALEPLFAYDYMLAHFEKIAKGSAAQISATGSSLQSAFQPTPGKAPKIPKIPFPKGSKVASLGLAACTLLFAVKPVTKK